MNTSSNRNCDSHPRSQVQSFHYPVIAHPAFRREATDAASNESALKAREQAMQQELAAAVEAARAEGFRQGATHAQEAATQAVEKERATVLSALQDFEGQRGDYFRRVETEVLRLALSIARKVLHREAQMDPLLLAGVVRVALDQMQAGARVVLRAPSASADVWQKFCAQHYQGQRTVEVVVDNDLEGDRVLLQAEVGSSEISLDNQLQEIESGFFDLVRDRMGAKP